MLHIIRTSTAGIALSAVLVLAGCAGHAFSPDSSGTSTVPAAITPDLSYRFVLYNRTTYDLEMESLGEVCMDATIHGTIHAGETKDVTVDTHNGDGCLFDASRFTTKFTNKADGSWHKVDFLKADLHPWEISNGGGELKVQFVVSRAPTHIDLYIDKP
jgi:hypothetical protein